MSNKKQTRVGRKNKKIRTFSKILCIISIIVMGLFIYMLYNANILPMKYFIPVVSVLVILKLFYILFTFKWNTKKIILIIIDILAVIIMAIEGFAFFKINETLNFLDKNLNVKFDTNVYHIIVKNDSEYKKLTDIKGKTVESFKESENTKTLESAVKEKVKVKIKYTKNAFELLNEVLKDNKKIILVNSGNYDAMVENEPNYEKETRILDSIEVKTKIEAISINKNVTTDPFIIYLSGIDTRSGGMPARSLSDVNMFIVMNPKTKQMLMVNIPRDYFVTLHGLGAKDKLTHAGTLGGVNLSKQTVEDIFGQKADYYVRVNFNSVINLVDAVGGITLYNDQNHSFSCWTDKSCTFKPGNNNVNGKCALAFARERHAYSSGDRHRGENQQQVIQKVFEKITSSSTIISNYSNILNSLNGTFESSLSTDDITSLVKMQINDMSAWKTETANLDGKTGSSTTYASPSKAISVMYPNEESINKAKAKIKEVLEA